MERRYDLLMQIFGYGLCRGFLISVVWLCCTLSSVFPVAAQVGIVRTVEGQVSVSSGRQECAPRYGLDLDEGDAIRTGDKAWALLTMMDGAKITVRPDTEVRIDVYRYTDAGDPAQNQARFTLMRGAIRVASARIAIGHNNGFLVTTPDASMDLRGADNDITYLAPKVTPAGTAQSGTYGRSYAGEAVLKNAGGEVTVRAGQTAFAELRMRVPPRMLSAEPYFYYLYGYIDRRAAAVAEKLDAILP